MQIFGKCHARRWRVFQQIRNFINFKLHVCHILTFKKQGIQVKIVKCLSTQFDGKTSAHMRKILKHESNHAISLIMSYENSNSLVFKVLGVFVYFFIYKYLCTEYFCLQRESRLYLLHRGFEDNSFCELSWIDIPEVLLNIVACYGYIQEKHSTLILMCRSKFVVILPIKRV